MFSVEIELSGVIHCRKFSHEGRAHSFFREWSSNAETVFALRGLKTTVRLLIAGKVALLSCPN